MKSPDLLPSEGEGHTDDTRKAGVNTAVGGGVGVVIIFVGGRGTEGVLKGELVGPAIIEVGYTLFTSSSPTGTASTVRVVDCTDEAVSGMGPFLTLRMFTVFNLLDLGNVHLTFICQFEREMVELRPSLALTTTPSTNFDAQFEPKSLRHSFSCATCFAKTCILFPTVRRGLLGAIS